MRIGVDFDNTIVCYDEAFLAVAKQEGLLPASAMHMSKIAVREAVRGLENGEYQWQRLQGLVYGRLIMRAKLFEGVEAFFHEMGHVSGVELFIVSHKTELAHHDPLKTSLRASALGFLEAHGFFDRLGLPRSNVIFESTMEEKIARIEALDFSIFIDDLPDVLLDPSFPRHTQRIFFSDVPEKGLDQFTSWRAIHDHIKLLSAAHG